MVGVCYRWSGSIVGCSRTALHIRHVDVRHRQMQHKQHCEMEPICQELAHPHGGHEQRIELRRLVHLERHRVELVHWMLGSSMVILRRHVVLSERLVVPSQRCLVQVDLKGDKNVIRLSGYIFGW